MPRYNIIGWHHNIRSSIMYGPLPLIFLTSFHFSMDEIERLIRDWAYYQKCETLHKVLPCFISSVGIREISKK